MPRPQNEKPSYRHHKASGQAFVVIAGRQIYLGRYGSQESRDAYERETLQWQAHGQARAASGPPLIIAGLVAAYWKRIERDGLYMKNGKPTSERLCLRVALRPVVKLYGGKAAAAFGPLDLVTVRKALCSPLPPPAEGEKKRRVHTKPIVRTSVNKHLHRIRGMFRWAVSMQMIPPATWEALRSVDPIRRGHAAGTREPTKVLPADPRAVAIVLRNVTPTMATMIRLQWLTGMRPGEAVQMRLGDIDRKGDVWVYRPESHKTEHHGVAREIMLGPRAKRLLTPFLSLDRGAYLFRGEGESHVTETAYCRAITRACTEAGVARWTPNQLRHNAATRFRKIRGIEVARAVLGHTDAATTMIYAEADRKAAIELAQAIG